MWTLVNNAHVKIWVAVLKGVMPVGPPTYDGLAQSMPPGRATFSQPHVWGPRIVLPPTAVGSSVAGFLGDLLTTATYVQIVDDDLPGSYSWWQAIDLSPSTANSPTPGNYIVDAIFIMMQSVTDF